MRGVVKAIRYRDPAFLWQPVVSLTTTDVILYGFLSRSAGRSLALKLLKNVMVKLAGD